MNYKVMRARKSKKNYQRFDSLNLSRNQAQTRACGKKEQWQVKTAPCESEEPGPAEERSGGEEGEGLML